MTALPRTLRAALLFLVTAGMMFAVAGAVAAQTEDGPVVDILQLSGPVDPPVAAGVAELVERANARGSEVVVVQIDSPAGIAVDAREVTGPVAASEVPVVVWVGPGSATAGGAAAFLHASSSLPAMASDASVGPACPVTVSGGCDPTDIALLEELLAADAGDVERFATRALDAPTAVERGHAALQVDGLASLLVELDGQQVTTATGPRTISLPEQDTVVRFHSLGLLRRTLHATLSPAFVYLLLVGTLLLFLFEIFQPGFGVAGVGGLLLLPFAVYGIVVLPVSWWALALLVVGMLLLAADLAVAGLGVPTVAGAAGVATGSWWLYAVDSPLVRLSPWLVALVTVACVVFFVPVMTVVLRAQAGPAAAGVGEDLVGQAGVVRSVMNPEGHVFVAGALWRARWTGEDRGRIGTGTPVRVLGVDGAVLLVGDADAASEHASTEDAARPS